MDRPITQSVSSEEAVQALTDLRPFIAYLEQTSADQWAVDVVRTVGNKQNCLFGHLVNWHYGSDYEGDISPIWDWFEEMWATTYQVYPVNDGQNPKYPQATPKARTIAYLKNLWLGLEIPTWRGMELQYEHSMKNRVSDLAS
jgi:hypothetical protein